jgi:hypothetical protein
VWWAVLTAPTQAMKLPTLNGAGMRRPLSQADLLQELGSMDTVSHSDASQTGTGPVASSRHTWVPEGSISEWLIAGLLFVLTCLYYRLFYSYTVLHPDEGIILQGAQRVLSGQVLYRDFFSFITPGSYYWMALLFKIFGNSILVARAVLIIYGGFFSSIFYFLARRVCSRWTAIFTVYLFTLTCLPYEFRVLHNWDSTLWACLALYFAVRHLETPHWPFALAVGVFTSLTLLFEQSKGAGLVLGLATGFGLLAWTGHRRSAVKPGNLMGFLTGLTVPAAITFIYLAAHHALWRMLADCSWAFHHYSSVNRLPFGYPELFYSQVPKAQLLPWGLQLGIGITLSPFFILPVLPLMATGVLTFLIFRLIRRKGLSGRGSHFVVISSVLVALLLTVIASGRPDVSHLIIFNGPLFFLVLAWALEMSLFRSAFLDTARAVASLYLLFSFTALGLVLLCNSLNAHARIWTRRGILKAERPDAVINEIQSRVSPRGRIFVYPYQPLYYYLTDTINPTRFEYLMRGQHTPEQFHEAIRTLQASRVPVVVFQPSFPEFVPHSWPATPLKVLGGKDAMTEYILAHYRPCKTLTAMQMWQDVFMVRKDLSCDGPL